jgi:osmotically inducible lipoprotein OsmB
MVALSSSAGMSSRDEDTAIGAAAGAADGAPLRDGSGVGIPGGAVVAGVVGNQIGNVPM